MESELKKLRNMCSKVKPIDIKAMDLCRSNWDRLAKPLKSLGTFEDILVQIAGMRGSANISLHKKAIVVMCSDNGVVEEKVTQTDSYVTTAVTLNIGKGKGNINTLANALGAKVIPVDIGIHQDIDDPSVLNRKVSYGTGNIAKGPAMDKEQVIKAIHIGMELVKELKDEGYDIIGTGEMGIGNTTTSSAITSVLLNLPPKEVTGKGAGLTVDGIAHKVSIIEKAILINGPDPNNPLDVLRRLGGYDIAGLTGIFLGGMLYQIPIIIDGFISSVAALLAVRIQKDAIHYMIPSHISLEPACQYIMKELGLSPIIHGNLALGEGSGTAFLFPLLEMACNIYLEGSTFEDISVTAYEHLT
ncbi:MAG: nicotinate-nucleotide--dimethylbenzimidazole phosphoribosyltransferase [Anaerocolumna sp.]